MSCNGFNHAPNCKCSWRGGWKGKFSSSATQNGTFVLNARCPVCSQPVFYYQNRHGSKVFFDKIGHPWPKHPCTIHKTQEEQITYHNEKWQYLSSYEIEKSEHFRNKHSVKYHKKKVPYLFFFTSENLTETKNICVTTEKGASLKIRIYIYIEKHGGYCILEGQAYKSHPTPEELKKLKVIKLGKNKASFSKPVSKNKKTPAIPITTCSICKSRVSKKKMSRHLSKIHELNETQITELLSAVKLD